MTMSSLRSEGQAYCFPVSEVTLLDITSDPRFIEAVTRFNAGEYLEASDLFEDLFFEGVRDEPEFIRIFLQFSVGIYHAETGQRRPAVERIEEGLRVIEVSDDDHGIDLKLLGASMREAARALRLHTRPAWPQIVRKK